MPHRVRRPLRARRIALRSLARTTCLQVPDAQKERARAQNPARFPHPRPKPCSPYSLCRSLQASALKLGAEREELDAAVGLAAQRLEAGEPPTEDAEREWYRCVCRVGVLRGQGVGEGWQQTSW